MNNNIEADRRIQKTLSALRDSFFELVLSRSYDEITVSDIIKKANVGRSTFYQHFKSKDDILATSMRAPLSIFASCIEPTSCDEDLRPILEHFWQNRQFAPRVFSGTARRQVVNSLTELLEVGLKIQCARRPIKPEIPINLVAHQLAEAQLVIVIDWLLGKGSCSAGKLATHIERVSKSICEALLTCE